MLYSCSHMATEGVKGLNGVFLAVVNNISSFRCALARTGAISLRKYEMIRERRV